MEIVNQAAFNAFAWTVSMVLGWILLGYVRVVQSYITSYQEGSGANAKAWSPLEKQSGERLNAHGCELKPPRVSFPASRALLCFALLCFALLCFALLCFALLCFALLCFALLCFALLCFALLCFALLCFALLCFALL